MCEIWILIAVALLLNTDFSIKAKISVLFFILCRREIVKLVVLQGLDVADQFRFPPTLVSYFSRAIHGPCTLCFGITYSF